MIVPGSYDGRWPHIHFEVFSSLSMTTGGRYASLVSRLALPAAVYANTTTYSANATNSARISLSSDTVFRRQLRHADRAADADTHR